MHFNYCFLIPSIILILSKSCSSDEDIVFLMKWFEQQFNRIETDPIAYQVLPSSRILRKDEFPNGILFTIDFKLGSTNCLKSQFDNRCQAYSKNSVYYVS